MKNLGGRISVKCPVEHRPMPARSLVVKETVGYAFGLDLPYQRLSIVGPYIPDL
jgi:hypothetical protein